MALKKLPKGLGLDPSAVHSSRLTVESCSLNNLYIRICSIRTKNGGKRETPFSLSSRILRRSWQSSVFPLLIAPCCGCSSHGAVPWTLVQIGSRSLFGKHRRLTGYFPCHIIHRRHSWRLSNCGCWLTHEYEKSHRPIQQENLDLYWCSHYRIIQSKSPRTSSASLRQELRQAHESECAKRQDDYA